MFYGFFCVLVKFSIYFVHFVVLSPRRQKIGVFHSFYTRIPNVHPAWSCNMSIAFCLYFPYVGSFRTFLHCPHFLFYRWRISNCFSFKSISIFAHRTCSVYYEKLRTYRASLRDAIIYNPPHAPNFSRIFRAQCCTLAAQSY